MIGLQPQASINRRYSKWKLAGIGLLMLENLYNGISTMVYPRDRICYTFDFKATKTITQ
jgi:hypothetical protein